MRLSDRYILQSHIGPFFLGLGVLTFIFMVDIVVDLLELFLVNDVPFLVVLELIVLSLGHVLALTIPMAVLVSTLLAFSQMEAENEITAMRSGGTSLYRIILAPFVAAMLLTLFMFVFSNFLLPESNHKLKNLLRDIRKKKPALAIDPGRFISDIPGYSIYVREKNSVSGLLEDVYLFEENKHGGPKVISAEHGRLLPGQDTRLRLELLNGEQFDVDVNEPEIFQITAFDRMEIILDDMDRELRRRNSKHRGDREMSVAMLANKIDTAREDLKGLKKRTGEEVGDALEATFGLLQTDSRETWLIQEGYLPNPNDSTSQGAERSPPKTVRLEKNLLRLLENMALNRASVERKELRHLVEYHKKFSIPFACLIFILLGAPIAIKMGRSGKGWGIAFSILLFAGYYAWITGGEQLADRRFLPPWMAMWMPNIALSLLGAWLLFWTNRESRPFSLFQRLNEWMDRRRKLPS
jgi:lipopolysaccharide export system permease protein